VEHDDLQRAPMPEPSREPRDMHTDRPYSWCWE
jgi:hypothetical protein